MSKDVYVLHMSSQRHLILLKRDFSLNRTLAPLTPIHGIPKDKDDDDEEEEERFDRTSCTFGDLPGPGPASHPPSASPDAGTSGTWAKGESEDVKMSGTTSGKLFV